MTNQLSDQLHTALGAGFVLERELGAGGMATVYLAQDRKHDRRVAIKVLHAELAAVLGSERFLQEIRLAANLQHPHILGLIDSGVFGDDAGTLAGRPYYVMPYLTGESLRQRLEREQQLPVAEAVRISCEVASALDYAHRNNVIHRDIKPENILLHDGSAVVADFGIALAVQSAGGQRMTQTGLSLGTPQYMSPEQAMGERTNSARSDIYSLGAVTYEMLTGEPPFTGPTVQAIVARLMGERPRAVTTQRRSVPVHVEAAVLKALEKVPADRFDSAAEFAAALSAPTGSVPVGVRARQTSRVSASNTVLVAVALVATTLAVAGWWRAMHQTSPPVALKLDLPSGHRLHPRPAIAVSPDGQSIVYVGVDSTGNQRLYLRALGSLESRAIPGADRGALNPSFTDDGRSIVFQHGLDVARIPVEGGQPTTLVVNPGLSAVVAGPRGEVIYSARNILWKVTAGSQPVALVRTDSTRREIGIDNPVMLEDGKTIAFNLVRRDTSGALHSLVAVTSIDGGAHHVLEGVEARKVIAYDNGYLLYAGANGNLMAVQVDMGTHRARGDVVTLVTASGPPGQEMAAAISRTGTLAYAVGREAAQLVVLNTQGFTTVTSDSRPALSSPVWSPDGRRVAVGVGIGGAPGIGGGSGTLDGNDVWIFDVSARVSTRLTTNGTSSRPAWSADGRRVAYSRNFGARSEIWWAAADGSGKEERLVAIGGEFGRIPEVTFAPGGQFAVVRAGVRPTGGDAQWHLYVVPLDGKTPPSLLFQSTTGTVFNPVVSPNGKWIAYIDGRGADKRTLLVRPFRREGGIVQVSAGEGTEPQWSRDSRRLFYRGGNAFRAANLSETGGSLVVTGRDSLFVDLDPPIFVGHQQYDVHPDGNQFVVVRHSGAAEAFVLTNWLEAARARLRRAAHPQ